MFDESTVETFFDVIPFGIYVVDISDHTIVFMNKALTAQRGDLTGQRCHQALFQESNRCPHCTICRLFDDDGRMLRGQAEVFELFNPVDDRWYQMQERAMAWPDGRLVKCSIAVDISELKATQNRLAEAHAELALRNRKLRTLSTTDHLTGIYNRVKLEETFSREADRAERYNTTYSLIMLDIDRFKLVNDEHGHGQGDEVLKAVAGLIQSNIRKTDTLGRWGGEEFLIICPETSLEGAETMAEKLRSLVEAQRHPNVGRVTGSFGVASSRSGEGPSEVTRRADEALYSAKKAGRNQVATKA